VKGRLWLTVFIIALLFGHWSVTRMRSASLWPECFSSWPVLVSAPAGATYCVRDPAGYIKLFFPKSATADHTIHFREEDKHE
jgi:hypothetical protein